MEINEEQESSWGGARQGSGRKKKYAKTYFFNATPEVMEIIEAVEGSRTDFINACITYYHQHHQ